MAMISRTDLENAKADSDALSVFVNGSEISDAAPRLGGVVPTIRKITKTIRDWYSGGPTTTATLGGQQVRSPAKLINDYAAQLAALGLYTYRGEWATATDYSVRDIVSIDGVFYVTITAHTSGTFATDLAANKWSEHDIPSRSEIDVIEETLDRIAPGRNFVFIVMGQSNAVGRADLPVADYAAGHVFSRVLMWTDRSGVKSFEVMDPTDTVQKNTGTDSGVLHGIEPYIGYLFERYFPNDRLYIIRSAIGGAGLGYDNGAGSFDPALDGGRYDIAVALITEAMAELPAGYIKAGLWWMQGETDATDLTAARAYSVNFETMINSLFIDVSALVYIPLFLGRITLAPDWVYAEQVRANMLKFCLQPEWQATLIDTDRAELNDIDNVHYTGNGFAWLGERLFKAIFGLGGAHLAPAVPPYESIDVYPVELRGSTAPATIPCMGTLAYTIHGRRVDGQIVMQAGTSLDGATGDLRIVGLPFKVAPVISGRPCAVVMSNNLSIPNKYLVGFIDAGTYDIDFYSPSDGNVWAKVSVPGDVIPTIFISFSVFIDTAPATAPAG